MVWLFSIKQGTKHMSAELSYKDLEQKVEYQDMYIEQLHHVISGLNVIDLEKNQKVLKIHSRRSFLFK